MVMICELCGQSRSFTYRERQAADLPRAGFGNVTAFLQPGPLYREHRKLQNQVLHQRIVTRDYMEVFERYAQKLVRLMQDDSDHFSNHIGR